MPKLVTKKDIVGKTIQEIINEYNFKVKLGADKGSNFVYCGPLDNRSPETIDLAIVDMYKRSLQNLENFIHATKAKDRGYETFVEETETAKKKKREKIEKETGLSLSPKALEELNKSFDTSKTAYEKWKNSIKNSISRAQEKKLSLQHAINNYTTIKDKTIVDCYKSIDEPNTLILIYEGRGRGFAWTTEEFNKGNIEENI